MGGGKEWGEEGGGWGGCCGRGGEIGKILGSGCGV